MLEPVHQQDYSYDDVLNPYSSIPLIQYQMQDQIRMLTTQVAQMNVQISQLEQIVKDQALIIFNESARAYNSSCIIGSQALRPLKNLSGLTPDQASPPLYFPVTRADLFDLSSAQCDKLLKFYGLPAIEGKSVTPIHHKYKSISSHIGLRD